MCIRDRGAAVRFENYSDFGSTVNYKAVTRYKIGNALTLRGSVSTGFRAPSMQQRFYAKTNTLFVTCLLYTSDAADERSSVDLGGRRIIKKKQKQTKQKQTHNTQNNASTTILQLRQ